MEGTWTDWLDHRGTKKSPEHLISIRKVDEGMYRCTIESLAHGYDEDDSPKQCEHQMMVAVEGKAGQLEFIVDDQILSLRGRVVSLLWNPMEPPLLEFDNGGGRWRRAGDKSSLRPLPRTQGHGAQGQGQGAGSEQQSGPPADERDSERVEPAGGGGGTAQIAPAGSSMSLDEDDDDSDWERVPAVQPEPGPEPDDAGGGFVIGDQVERELDQRCAILCSHPEALAECSSRSPALRF